MTVSPAALAILKQALCANGPRKHWGSRNSYFAATKASEPIQELLDAGHLIRGTKYPNQAHEYHATPSGMRAARLGPGAIEKASKFLPKEGAGE